MSDKWNKRFIELCNHIAQWSKDTSTKVGAVIVDADKRILSVGYNGFPAGVDDDVEARHKRPAKYMYTEHAERNSLYTSSRNGVSVVGATMYCNYFPCPDCTRAIIQSGIKTVYYEKLSVNSGKNEEHINACIEMFDEANVNIWQI